MELDRLASLDWQDRLQAYTKLEETDGVNNLCFALPRLDVEAGYIFALVSDKDDLNSVAPLTLIFGRGIKGSEAATLMLIIAQSRDLEQALEQQPSLVDEELAEANMRRMAEFGLPLCALTVAKDRGGQIKGLFQWTAGSKPAESLSRLELAIRADRDDRLSLN